MGGILHNMLYRVAAARQPIRDEDAVNIFQRFRECSDSMIACKALILQVNLDLYLDSSRLGHLT